MGFLSSLFIFSTLALAPLKTSKDEFVFGNENEPETLDPQKVSGVPDNNIVVQMFEGLLQQGPDWVSLRPGMAQEIPQPQDSGKKYVFRLRPDLKWSDGSPLTAKDFEWSWLRAMRSDTMSPYSYWLTDNILGASEYAANPSPENQRNVGVRAIDDLTFEVKLNKPVPYFLNLTAESVLYPVKREVVEKHGDLWIRPENIVSNGAYKMSHWEVNKRIRLTKNPFYWNAKNVAIEHVIAYPINDKQTAVSMFRQGQLDWTGHNGAPNALVPSYRSDPYFRVEPAFITYFYRFNTTRPPLNDSRVRQALALAIDREALVEQITRGGEQAAYGLVPLKTGRYRSPVGMLTRDFQENLQKAKALLAEAGYPDGKGLRPLSLQYDTKELHKRIAQALQVMWKNHLGVEVRPFNLEWKVYLAQQRAMDFDISRSGWMGDYPDPASFLELFVSHSGNNHTGFSNKEYDRLFERSSVEVNPEKRLEILQQAEAILLQELPIAPLFYYTNFSFVRPEIRGFEPNLIDRPYVKFLKKE
jgi:oligopeptide transport system substrate-binding protein